jgi:hypothetical protein|tara:strand:+ start:97 stop:417 length:321 start_codon:yes stop_codon:yes gene_type:complete
VPPDKTKLPKHVIDIWPDVFKDIDLKVVPLDYLHSIRVVFQDGKIWDIDIQNSKDEDGRQVNIKKELEDIFRQYERDISNVDFRLDTERVKRDIKKRTALFMKKRK